MSAIGIPLLLFTYLSGTWLVLVPQKHNQKIAPISSLIFLTALFLSTALIIMHWNEPVKASWQWFRIGQHPIEISFEINRLTSIALALSSFISFLVVLYSRNYMIHDHSHPRYFATLSLFAFSMTGLVLASNLLLIFFFWEAVGLCSYLLIGYYRNRTDAASSAQKAFLMNKIGDAGFIFALMVIWQQTNTFDLSFLHTPSSSFSLPTSLAIGAGLLLAIASKSVQFPLHTWLPDAMTGPTPVSALIHSATMVAAGVFLLSRLQFLFPQSLEQTITIVGAITAFVGGWNAMTQFDLKKLLAYSTMSQLGLMVMVFGAGSADASVLHLVVHGAVKSGLFLVAGLIIVKAGSGNLHHPPVENHKDIRTLTASRPLSRFLSISLIIFSLSLIGFPLTTGFISKEVMVNSISSPLFIILFFVLNALTIIYTIRLIAYLIPKRIEKTNLSPAIAWPGKLPVLILLMLCCWIFLTVNPFGVNTYFQPHNHSSIFLPLAGPLWITAITFFTFQFSRKYGFGFIERNFKPIEIDSLYSALFVKPVLKISNLTHATNRVVLDGSIHLFGGAMVTFSHLVAWLDTRLVDGLVKLVSFITIFIGGRLRRLSNGNIQNYLWWSLTAFIIFLIWRY